MTFNEIENRACSRCGYINDLEQHHIIHRIAGGSNDKTNLRWLCRACHDYQHAKEKVIEAIKVEEKRIAILQKRLKIIEDYNKPEKIRELSEQGKIAYQSYFPICNEMLPNKTKCGREL